MPSSPPKVRVHVLCAGLQWKGTIGPNEFAAKCTNRRNRLVAMARVRTAASMGSELLHFYVFEFATGRLTKEVVAVDKGELPAALSTYKTTPPVPWGHQKRAVRMDEVRNGHLRMQNAAALLSVVDVYHALARLGSEPATKGTVEEWSFFGHAYPLGPVPMDTLSQPEFERLGVRDPLDCDPRKSDFELLDKVHFQGGASALACLRLAFSPTAYLWIWGCNLVHNWHEVFTAMWNSGLSLSKKTPAHVVLRLRGVKDPDNRRYVGWCGSSEGPEAAPIYKVTVANLVELFRRFLNGGYAYQFCLTVDRVAYVGLAGTSAISDTAKGALLKTAKDSLDAVNLDYGTDTAKRLAFYRIYLGQDVNSEQTMESGIEIDPAIDARRRGYGRLVPQQTKQ